MSSEFHYPLVIVCKHWLSLKHVVNGSLPTKSTPYSNLSEKTNLYLIEHQSPTKPPAQYEVTYFYLFLWNILSNGQTTCSNIYFSFLLPYRSFRMLRILLLKSLMSRPVMEK